MRELNAGSELPNVTASVTKMVGIEPPEWRLRAGDYRARFYVEHGVVESGEPEKMADLENVVVVFKVGHRREVYRD
ncbi:hypothetical protein D3C72_540740 [compost metagenome]